jgi:Thioesterase superfamily
VTEQDRSVASVSDLGITGPAPQGGWALARADDPTYALSNAVRRINDLIVGARLDDACVEEATATMNEIADKLESSAVPGRRPRIHPDPSGPAQDFFPTSPVIGFANPIAPPVHVEKVDGGLDGTVFFDWPYEGPPGCVHGGVIALVFDELLGAANIAAGSPGMTGTLTIRYRRPTPIRTQIRLVSRFEGRDGRKIRTTAQMYNGEELTAQADAIFIELSADRFFGRITQQS